MRKALIKAAAFIAILAWCFLSLEFAHAALSTSTDATVNVIQTGRITIYWPFAAAADGTDSVHVTKKIDGLLDAAYIVDDPNYPLLTLSNTHTLTFNVKEVLSYGGTDTLIDTAIHSNTFVIPPKSSHIWPTTTVPVSSELQLDVSNALTSTGAGAHGVIVMTISPNLANGD